MLVYVSAIALFRIAFPQMLHLHHHHHLAGKQTTFTRVFALGLNFSIKNRSSRTHYL